MTTTEHKEPCKFCGAEPELIQNPCNQDQWRAACPNRNKVKGRTWKAENAECSGTAYRRSQEAAIASWNREQQGYEAVERKPWLLSLVRCQRCGLRGEHECLRAEGFQRRGHPWAESLHPRMS